MAITIAEGVVISVGTAVVSTGAYFLGKTHGAQEQIDKYAKMGVLKTDDQLNVEAQNFVGFGSAIANVEAKIAKAKKDSDDAVKKAKKEMAKEMFEIHAEESMK